MGDQNCRRFTGKGASFLIAAFLVAQAAQAETPAPAPALTVELNTAQDVENACRLSFLVQNDLADALSEFVVETVVFDRAGQVERLTLFDFQSLPTGRPRVRQFDLTGVACDQIGMLLINGVDACTGAEAGQCQAALRLATKTTIALQG